jgi:hypothetical protein
VGNTALEANQMFSKAGLAGGAWPKFVIAGVSWWNLACFQGKRDLLKLPLLLLSGLPNNSPLNKTTCTEKIAPYFELGRRSATIEFFLDSSYSMLQRGTRKYFSRASVVRILSPVLAAPSKRNGYHHLNRVLLNWAANKIAIGHDPQFLDQTTWMTDRAKVKNLRSDINRDFCFGSDINGRWKGHGIHVMTLHGQLIRSMYAFQSLMPVVNLGH